MSYTAWPANRPDGACGPYDRAQLWGRREGQWDDTYRADEQAFLSEWESAPQALLRSSDAAFRRRPSRPLTRRPAQILSQARGPTLDPRQNAVIDLLFRQTPNEVG